MTDADNTPEIPQTNARKPKRLAKVCGPCGTVMMLTPSRHARRVYCSTACTAEALKKTKTKTFCCGFCRMEVIRYGSPSKDKSVFCSRACGAKHRSLMIFETAALSRMARAAKDQAARIEEKRNAIRERNIKQIECAPKCRQCGQAYARERTFQRYCTDACSLQAKSEARARYRDSESYRASKRKGKSKRRAMLRGCEHESIDPIKVFERDKWRCHLCGIKTPRSLRGTMQDRAPELEHIVSLADGGSHTWGNVACSCRKCNIHKGSSSAGQLGLGFAA